MIRRDLCNTVYVLQHKHTRNYFSMRVREQTSIVAFEHLRRAQQVKHILSEFQEAQKPHPIMQITKTTPVELTRACALHALDVILIREDGHTEHVVVPKASLPSQIQQLEVTFRKKRYQHSSEEGAL